MQNIGVNVVANLVAAAIIYLLGVAFRLLPSDPRVVALASIFLMSVAGTTLSVAANVVSKRGYSARSARLAGIAGILLGLVLIVMALFFMLPQDKNEGYVTLGFGGLFIVSSAAIIVTVKGKRDAADGLRAATPLLNAKKAADRGVVKLFEIKLTKIGQTALLIEQDKSTFVGLLVDAAVRERRVPVDQEDGLRDQA